VGDRLGGLVLACVVLVGVGLAFPSGEEGEFETLSAPAKPTRLVVPSLGIRAPVVPVELGDDAVLDPPDDPGVVGWWTGSRRPGADSGQTVLTGHTVHEGGGVMDRLGRLREGGRYVVVTPRGRVHYEVDQVETLSTSDLAERNEELFAQDRGDNRMLLITCTGWDGAAFTENVVVSATQLGTRQRQPDRARASG
jgi:LPXTG-site transpeptidase (sortase) family protein